MVLKLNIFILYEYAYLTSEKLEFENVVIFRDLHYTTIDSRWFRSVTFKLSVGGFVVSKMKSVHLFGLVTSILSLFFASGYTSTDSCYLTLSYNYAC